MSPRRFASIRVNVRRERWHRWRDGRWFPARGPGYERPPQATVTVTCPEPATAADRETLDQRIREALNRL